ncbi:MAG: ABC transporter [Promethearchaeota archaeon CR_4]|nr:MAG: ABC transporter [Candidatus Lokiarchaeota archaeon CR_4]
MTENNFTENTIVVRFSNLTRRFGKFTAVSSLNLQIHEGEIVGLLGPNGAGKSTTMKMMAYLIRPTEGDIFIRHNGTLERLTNTNKDYLLDRFGFLIENPAFYDNVTPRQILSYFAELRGYPSKLTHKRVEDVVTMMGLSEWIDKKISTFSKGMRQKIGILSTIVHDPQIVVLDEPSTGLDPKAQVEIREFLLKLKKMGKTIFISSHLLYEISEVADTVAILNHGQLIACDTVETLEAKAKKSIIQLELFPNPNGQLQEVTTHLTQLVSPLTGLESQKNQVRYNGNTRAFEILFDGNPEHQVQILKTLTTNNFNVSDFSVPRAGLLEDLYLNLIQKGENDQNE